LKICASKSALNKPAKRYASLYYLHAGSDLRALRCMSIHGPAMQRVEQFCFAALLLLIDYGEA